MACIPAEARPVDDYITTERVALAVHLLTLGRKYTTAQVAELVGLEHGGAWAMLSKISRVLPLYLDDERRWTMFYDMDK